jgi:glycerol-3-phosphate dehydrogenase (NAD(P)+)
MNQAIGRAAVIGDGAMGTVCALLLAGNGVEVQLWGRSRKHIESIAQDRENVQYLPGHPLPDSIHLTNHAGEAFDGAELVVSAVPCQFMRGVWKSMALELSSHVPVVCVSKGIEIDTLLCSTQILESLSVSGPFVALSGPSIAPEVAAGLPATVVAAADDPEAAVLVQRALSSPTFRVYTNDDLVGVELAGAMKNVIALAAGICDGIGAGCNAKASLLTRGLVEISRFGVALGAKPETFHGLAGTGDLVTTCISPASRNRTAGERIGKGMAAEDVVTATNSVIEGIPTTRAVLQLAAKHSVEMPITEAVGKVIFEGCTPKDAIFELMTRELKSE